MQGCLKLRREGVGIVWQRALADGGLACSDCARLGRGLLDLDARA